MALRYNIGLLPWSPLAMGMLAGRYSSAQEYPHNSRAARIGSIYADRITQTAIDRGNEIIPIARERGLSPAQLALLWVKDQPAVTAPIIGPRSEAHLDDALAVLEKRLDEGTAAELDRVTPPGSAYANFHNTSGWMKMSLPA